MGSKSIWSRIFFLNFNTTTISRVFYPVYDVLKAISKSLETVSLSFYRSKNKIWTRPNIFGTGPKLFELVQNSFRPIDGQGKCEEKKSKCNFKIILTPLCVWGVKGRADIQILFRFSPFFKVTQRGLCWIFSAWNVMIWRFFFWFDWHTCIPFFCLQFYTTVKQSIMFCLILSL